MTAALYTYVWHASFWDFNWNSTGFGWMGNAAKGGMEIYTPVHIVHVLRFLHVIGMVAML